MAVVFLLDLECEEADFLAAGFFPVPRVRGSTEADLDFSSPSDKVEEFKVANVEILVVSLLDLLTESSGSDILAFLLF